MSLDGDCDSFRELLRKKPFLERWLPIAFEQMRLWGATNPQESSQKLLPDYCYNIFAIQRRTYFKIMPTFDETVTVTEKECLAQCKSIDEAKQFLNIRWRHLGRVIGVLTRGIRFFDLEVERELERDGLLNLKPEEEKLVGEMVWGSNFSRFLKAFVKSQKIGHGTKRLRKYFSSFCNAGNGVPSHNMQAFAYQWGPDAMVEFNAGMAEGMKGVLDDNGHLAGESPRANVYNFLLLVWPEIKEMLDSNPRKTLTDLHEWMMPYMRLGVVNLIDLDYLRDVCGPPSQSGIGLQLRPLSSRFKSA